MAERHDKLKAALKSIDEGKVRVQELLESRLKVRGGEREWSIVATIETDLEVDPKEDGDWVSEAPNTEEILETFVAGHWWYSTMIVEVLYGGSLMGCSALGAVVGGQVPGSPFHNEWEDEDDNWLELADSAVQEAAQLVQAMKAVEYVRFEEPPLVSATGMLDQPEWPKEAE